jgi:hypothetical protein
MRVEWRERSSSLGARQLPRFTRRLCRALRRVRARRGFCWLLVVPLSGRVERCTGSCTGGGGGSRAQRPRRVLRRMPRRRWSARSSSPSRLAAHTKPTPTSTSGNASSTMTTTIATLFIRSVCLVSNTYGASRSFEDAGLSGKGRLRLRGGLCSDGGGRTPRWRLVGWNRGTGVVKMNPDGAQRYPTVCPPLP